MLKNKVFILLIIFIVFSLFIPSSCFASTENTGFVYTDDSGKIYNLPIFPDQLKNYNHYIIFKYNSLWNNFVIIPFNESIEVVPYATSFNFLVDGKKLGTHWVCDFNNGYEPDSWGLGMTGSTGEIGYNFSSSEYYTVVSSCSCSYSYLNSIENAMNNLDSFFLNRQAILVPIMEKAPLAKVMEEILKILPMILMTLVGLIGLRKALRFLSTVLHHS